MWSCEQNDVEESETLKRPSEGYNVVRPPAPGCLCGGSGSAFPSPGLKCPAWVRGLALVPVRGLKEPGKVVGSVRSPRSSVGPAFGRVGA